MSTELLQTRVKEASVVLHSYLKDNTSKIILQALERMGIDDSELGMKILQSPTTNTADFFVAIQGVTLNSSLPEPRVRVAWSILQGRDPFTPVEVSDITNVTNISDTGNVAKILEKLEQQKPVGQWGDLDLLKAYAKNCPMSIEEELLKRSRGRPVIVFTSSIGTVQSVVSGSGTVNVEAVNIEASMALLRQARYMETPNTFIVDSQLLQVYKVGDFPMDVAYECPVHSNVLLLNGYCDECGLKWDDVEKNKDKYVFLRLVAEKVKIEPVALRMYLQQSFDELVKLFPKVLLTYNALKEEDKLPTLKRRMSKNKQGDPFRVVHTTY